MTRTRGDGGTVPPSTVPRTTRTTHNQPTGDIEMTNDTNERPTVWELARIAGLSEPSTNLSAGAEWLRRVHGELAETVERCAGGEDPSDVIAEQADSLAPIYTHDVWATYVDLGAYDFDVADYGITIDAEDMTNYARITLGIAADHLLHMLWDGHEAAARDDATI